MIATRWKTPFLLSVILSPLVMAGCSQTASHGMSVAGLVDSVRPSALGARPYRYTDKDKNCLERAMFFESNRSSRDGMVAVGTVVMNRLKSGEHGDTICAVVGEKRQFAPGVMTRRMNSKAMPDVEEAAVAVLKGERSSKLKNAMHFHTAGLKFPYKNMHYVLVAGGNAFYEKRGRNWKPLPPDSEFAVASAAPGGTMPGVKPLEAPVAVAFAGPQPASTVATRPQPARGSEANVVAVLPAAKPSAEASTVLASAQPDSARFGSPPSSRTSEPDSSPFMVSSVNDDAQPTMSFQSTPDDTSAIGAMIVTESRPMEEQW